jgi:uncharacterized protein YbcV (DUF1398 family)
LLFKPIWDIFKQSKVKDLAQIARLPAGSVTQRGETNYSTFCRHCAETGFDKWFVSLDKMTCTYYDKSGNEMPVEQIPQ